MTSVVIAGMRWVFLLVLVGSSGAAVAGSTSPIDVPELVESAGTVLVVRATGSTQIVQVEPMPGHSMPVGFDEFEVQEVLKGSATVGSNIVATKIASPIQGQRFVLFLKPFRLYPQGYAPTGGGVLREDHLGFVHVQEFGHVSRLTASKLHLVETPVVGSPSLPQRPGPSSPASSQSQFAREKEAVDLVPVNLSDVAPDTFSATVSWLRELIRGSE